MDLREQIAALSEITTNIDAYLERRAGELAQPLIDMAKDEAAKRIREAESEVTRQQDLVTELRRQLKPAVRYGDQYRERTKQAEATIARVKALAERWRYVQDRKRAADELRAALDQPGDQSKGT